MSVQDMHESRQDTTGFDLAKGSHQMAFIRINHMFIPLTLDNHFHIICRRITWIEYV